MGGNFFDMPFPLTHFMLQPDSSQIVGCCVKILSILKEFLKNIAANFTH